MDIREYLKNKIQLSEEIFDIVSKSSKLINSKDSEILDSKKYLDSRILSFYQQKYKFGYFPPTDFSSVYSESNIKTLMKIGVLYKKDYRFDSNFKHHSIVFPIIDDFGYAVGLIARTIKDQYCKDNNVSKYKYSQFKKSFVLYGLNFAKEAIRLKKSAILVEGQFDRIACDYTGQHNVVAMGGSSLCYFQLYLLKKYGAKKIYLLTDNDVPGEKANNRIIKKFGEFQDFERLAFSNEYHDIDEYVKLNKSNESIFDNI